MIVLRNLTKIFSLHGRHQVVADNINVTFPTNASVGLLGRNGAGKSTLLKIIAGTTDPTYGEVLSTGSISFPVGLASSVHPDLTGAQNSRFVARIYGADTDALMDFVEDFAELGPHFHLPVRSYSSGMRGRLMFGINMGLKFDTYLVDEVTAVGDAIFKRKSREVFLDRMKDSGAVFVSHSTGQIRDLCTSGAVLQNGRLDYYEDVEEAIDRYMQSLEGGTAYYDVSAPPDGAAEMSFPRDVRMLFGIGAPQTGIGWLADCLRRHRPCHFGPNPEPHYFDVRAGLGDTILQRRIKQARQLATRMDEETGETQRTTVNLLNKASDLLRIYAAPFDGSTRHDAYIDYLLARRKKQPVVCDFTPAYATLDQASFIEMATIGGARFVYVLRDPAMRIWCQIWDKLPAKTRNEHACTKAAQALIDAHSGETGLTKWIESDYARTMTCLEKAAPQDRILYLFHETLFQKETLQVLCDFLDVPVVPDIAHPPVPEETTPPLPPEIETGLRRLLSVQYEFARDRFGSGLPKEWTTKPNARTENDASTPETFADI